MENVRKLDAPTQILWRSMQRYLETQYLKIITKLKFTSEYSNWCVTVNKNVLSSVLLCHNCDRLQI